MGDRCCPNPRIETSHRRQADILQVLVDQDRAAEVLGVLSMYVDVGEGLAHGPPGDGFAGARGLRQLDSAGCGAGLGPRREGELERRKP